MKVFDKNNYKAFITFEYEPVEKTNELCLLICRKTSLLDVCDSIRAIGNCA